MINKNKKKKFKVLYLFYFTFIILGIVVYIIYLATNQIFFENITGQSAIDGFSIYHFVAGTLLCSLFLIILSKYSKKESITFIIMLAFVLTVILGIIFEIIENLGIIVDSGIKYNNSEDSLLNMTTDIILNSLGAVLVCYIYWKILKKKKRKK